MRNVGVINLQSEISVECVTIRSFVKKLTTVAGLHTRASFTVAIVPDDRMIQLNEMFRGKSATTDVLSFPHEPDEFDPDKDNLGDIVISAEQAQKQATENGLTLEGEIKQLILHGLLHLCGYDHETDNGEMNARELELRELLKI